MAYREFEDGSGAVWKVWDTYPQAAHRSSMAALRDGWLTFECNAERRRLVPAPAAWGEARDQALRDWLEKAEPVKTRMPDLWEDRPVPVPAADDRADDLATLIPRATEDMRVLIERSRQTLENVNRAIEGQRDVIGDPPPPHDRHD